MYKDARLVIVRFDFCSILSIITTTGHKPTTISRHSRVGTRTSKRVKGRIAKGAGERLNDQRARERVFSALKADQNCATLPLPGVDLQSDCLGRPQ